MAQHASPIVSGQKEVLRSHPTMASIEVITMPAGTSASYSAISRILSF
jgi:hypothetical protein